MCFACSLVEMRVFCLFFGVEMRVFFHARLSKEMSCRNPCFLLVFWVVMHVFCWFWVKNAGFVSFSRHVRLCQVEIRAFCLLWVAMRVFLLQMLELVMSGRNVCFCLFLGKNASFFHPLVFGQKCMFCLFFGRNACFLLQKLDLVVR